MSREIRIVVGRMVFFSQFDEVDAELVSSHRWHISDFKIPYLATNTSKNPPRKEYLHRLIMKAKPSEFVDHRNGNTLDNRRSNLRICTRADNLRNSKARTRNKCGAKGVHFRKALKNKWVARIYHDGKGYHLGNFPTREEAARAYDAAAKQYFGEFAFLNNL